MAKREKPTLDHLIEAVKDHSTVKTRQLLKSPWTAEELTAALRIAAEWYRPKQIELLLAQGASDPTRDVLRVSTDAPCMRLLWPALGVALDADGRREVLHAAVTARNPSERMLTYLLEEGLDVNAASADGTTGLHLAAARETGGSIVEVLLRFGADRQARTHAGDTPRDIAAQHGRARILTLLDAPA